jgi:predicted chitinase
MPLTLAKTQLKQFWPHAAASVISGTIAAWPPVQAKYPFNTALRCAHFWGQITWECGGGTELRESGRYSEKAILATFGVGRHSAAVSEREARQLAADCQIDGGRALFNRVYGVGNPGKAKELGNIGPDDGWLYRGAGALNTTGREAFARVGKAIGLDLVGNPDLANDPGIALWMGAYDYVELNCLAHADADDTGAETKVINGGTNGLTQRMDLVARWKPVFGAGSGAGAGSVANDT